MNVDFSAQAEQICRTGAWLNRQGWTPATSSNFSMRIDHELCALTASGKHKGHLIPDDILAVDMDGHSLDGRRPSAETLLHTQLYQWRSDINAVLHTHSNDVTVLSRALSDHLVLEGYELQKAFSGTDTHESRMVIPVFENNQNIPELAKEVGAWLSEHDDCVAYLIRGHGAYTWGKTMAECERHIEALESLVSCELKTMMLKR